jgi:hypothetical protein
MIVIQVETKTLRPIILLLEKEMERNPDGYVNLRIKSSNYPIPTPSWNDEIDD